MKKIFVLMAVLIVASATEVTRAQAAPGADSDIAGNPRPVVGPPGTSCSPGATVEVSPDTTLDNLFQSYGNSGTGTSWTGGDGTESVALPDGRELWLFDDSLLGTVTNGERSFQTAAFLHNSLIVENNGSLTKTYFTSATNAPGGATAFLSPRPRQTWTYAFWPAAAVVNGATVQILGSEHLFAKAKYGTETSKRGAYVATLSLPSLNPLSFQRLPFKEIGGDWIGGILTQDGYTYIYLNSGNLVQVARVVGTDLTSRWTYYDGNGWGAHLSKAVAIESVDFENHYSVTPVGGSYLFIAGTVFLTMTSWQRLAAVRSAPSGPTRPSTPPRSRLFTRRAMAESRPMTRKSTPS